MQCITTKYFGPTNKRPSKVKAQAAAGHIWHVWDHGLSVEGNHDAAARALAAKLDWSGSWFRGGHWDGSFAYVDTSDMREFAFTSRDKRGDRP
jgi:hypothetical protein